MLGTSTVIDFYLNKSGRSIKKTSNHFCIHRNTIGIWLKNFDKNNLKSLEPKSRKPLHTYRQKKISENTINKVVELKKEYPYYGKEKIKVLLKRIYGIEGISESSIGRIFREKKLNYLRRRVESSCNFKKLIKKRKRNKQRLKQFLNGKPILKAGQVIEIDTVRIYCNERSIYVINAIDVYSKFAVSYAYKSPSSKNAKDFLENKLLKFFGEKMDLKIDIIQTDNGSEFCKYFDKECEELNIKHVWTYPHTPKMNGCIERYNGTIQIECLERLDAIRDLFLVNEKIKKYLIEYNSFRPHQALNYLTPLDIYILSLIEQIKPSDVNPLLHNMLGTSTIFNFFFDILQKRV